MLQATFSDAKDMCTKTGGRLASITTAAENTQLKDAMFANDNQHATVWIGASDHAESGIWRWVDKGAGEQELLSEGYTRWAPGQPDGSGLNEHCVEMWSSGEWNDADCTTAKGWACKVVVPSLENEFTCSLAGTDASSAPVDTMCKYALLPATHNAVLRTMPVAKDLCNLQHPGSQLAQPRSKEEIRMLAASLRQTGHDSMWIGLHKDAGGQWKWSSTGQALSAEQSRWAPGQPDGDGACVEMWPDGTWNDRDCLVSKVFACEKSVQVA